MPGDLDFSLPSGRRRARFDDVYSELALHRAALKAYTKPLFSWRKALQTSHDGHTLYDFARHGQRKLEQLHHAFSNREFHFREGLELNYNLNGKERRIFLFPWEERIADLLLYQMLNRRFHSAFSPHSYAYRYRSFGLDLCQRRIARKMLELPRPLFLLKRDIASFFPSIDHDILLNGLAQWIEPGDYLYQLLEERVRFKARTGEGLKSATIGLPFGTAIACFLANFYLMPLDRSVESIPDLNYFGATATCPLCGSRYAKESLSGIKCPTPGCPNYERRHSAAGRAAESPANPQAAAPSSQVRTAVSSDFQNPISVSYVNHRGETRTFIAERDSIRLKGTHVSLRVAPKGVRIALKRGKITNFPELQPYVQPEMEARSRGVTAKELHVVRFHRRRGTTSPLCQQIKAKYPGL